MRICVITSGHLASCPRVVKAADAESLWGGPPGPLGNLTSRFPAEESAPVPRPRFPSWSTVDYRRRTAPITDWRMRLEFHAARWVRLVDLSLRICESA
jgi:hypothetical protein